MITTPPVSASAGEWIRIFACQLARRRPMMSANAVVDTAIEQYRALSAVAPEQAAADHCHRYDLATAGSMRADPYFAVPDTGAGAVFAGACAAVRSRTFSR